MLLAESWDSARQALREHMDTDMNHPATAKCWDPRLATAAWVCGPVESTLRGGLLIGRERAGRSDL